MLLISRVDIRNFVLFDRLVLEPSVDADRPMTIIRAEPGSGKTSLLRALRWGFYGEDGLPGADARARDRWGMQPISWNPEDGPVETSVTITFLTTGASRYETTDGQRAERFRLSRRVTTVGRETSSPDGPAFKRVDHRLTLQTKTLEGDWKVYDKDPEQAVDLLLPKSLQDFFFVDADEATDDFVGGGDRPRARQAIVGTTTKAVKELLGLGVFDDAMKRLKDHEADFRRQASRAAGDSTVDQLQAELDGAEARLVKKRETLTGIEDEIADLRDGISGLDQEIMAALRESGDPQDLRGRLDRNKSLLDGARSRRRTELVALSKSLEDDSLLGVLALEAAQSVHAMLHEQHERGLIPLTHLPFVREVLERGECLCGEPLTLDGDLRKRVESVLHESESQESRANLLGESYRAAADIIRRSKSPAFGWEENIDGRLSALGEIDDEIRGLTAEKEDIDKKLAGSDEQRIQTARAAKATSEAALEDLITQQTELNGDIKRTEEEVKKLAKELSSRTKQVSAVQQATRAETLAAELREALQTSYRRIESKQVEELSATMNVLFQRAVSDIRTDEEADAEAGTDLRAFQEVGVQPVAKTEGKYQIFAENRTGRSLASTEINGASRRVLAMSFILGLAKESRTEAPLVADSLLNMMSGTVRLNTMEAVASYARQPILLLTRDDIGDREVEAVERLAGKTYTFSYQLEPGLVNRKRDEQVTIVCECGVRDYCDICEHTGNRDQTGWNRREAAS